MTTEQIDISEKPMTPYLKQLLADLKESVASLKERVLAVYRQARYEDYTPLEARELIESTIEISAPYLRRILPEEALHKEKQNLYLKDDALLVAHNSLNTTSKPKPYDYDPKTVTITTKHDVIDPYEESQDRIDNLIKETQNQQLKPISEDQEDWEIKFNDSQTMLQRASGRIQDMERNYEKQIDDLKDQLKRTQTFNEVLEIKGQKIALVIEATNLKSVSVDETKSRRLNS